MLLFCCVLSRACYKQHKFERSSKINPQDGLIMGNARELKYSRVMSSAKFEMVCPC